MQDSNQQVKLHLVSQFLQHNENKNSLTETTSSAIKISQKARCQYIIISMNGNLQISNELIVNKK